MSASSLPPPPRRGVAPHSTIPTLTFALPDTTQHLALVLGSIFLFTLVLLLVFLRYHFHASRHTPVDPAYEARLEHMRAGGEKQQLVSSGWGITPLASEGPNGTR